ncbi:MAG: NADH-quinone oxidoreductase subunit B family protein [Synergistaceae bacterium]|jgi:membrane-bound hydrogenase subunit mbhJ|nr:NADH-quinone oxidoreductase subunit B family protein [Synergistaceae bacterium]
MKFFDVFDMFKALPKSLWVMTCNTGSCNGCDIEVVATLGPRYDIERFGMKLVGTPRHADVLVVTGPVTRFMHEKLLRVYNQMPDPKVVMVVGNCGCSGDVFYKSYNLDGPVDNVIPVDVYVHGCPPRPEAIIEGVAKTVLKLESLSGEKSGKSPAKELLTLKEAPSALKEATL